MFLKINFSINKFFKWTILNTQNGPQILMFRHVTWDEIRPPLFALSLYYAIRFHRGPGGKLGLDPPLSLF